MRGSMHLRVYTKMHSIERMLLGFGVRQMGFTSRQRSASAPCNGASPHARCASSSASVRVELGIASRQLGLTSPRRQIGAAAPGAHNNNATLALDVPQHHTLPLGKCNALSSQDVRAWHV